MRLKILKLAALLILLICARGALAQEASVEQSRLPYEVVVTPNVTMGNLKKLLVQIEDDFFNKFNELNLDDDYDVLCYEFVPTGSHIRKRVCEPNFFMDTRAANASEVMFVIGCNCPAFPPPLLDRPALKSATGSDFDVLEEKIAEFYSSDLELHSIGEAFADVKQRIDNFSKDRDRK